MKDLWFQVGHFFSQIWSGLWPVKAPFSLPVGCYSGVLGGEGVLLIVFSAMIVVDLFLGILLAFLCSRLDPMRFGRWVVTALIHSAVTGSAGVAAKSSLGPLQINFPLLDLFLGLLICTEALSILRNMQRLGLPVPKLATRILTDVQYQAEQRAADFFSRPENDRRRQPRGEVCEEPARGKAYDDYK